MSKEEFKKEQKMIDKNNKYTTRNGLPVRIYATDCGGECPVHGVVLDHHGWFEFGWASDGRTFINHWEVADCALDLVEIDCEEGNEIESTAW